MVGVKMDFETGVKGSKVWWFLLLLKHTVKKKRVIFIMERIEVIQTWYMAPHFQFQASYSIFILELEECIAEAPHT